MPKCSTMHTVGCVGSAVGYVIFSTMSVTPRFSCCRYSMPEYTVVPSGAVIPPGISQNHLQA